MPSSAPSATPTRTNPGAEGGNVHTMTLAATASVATSRAPTRQYACSPCSKYAPVMVTRVPPPLTPCSGNNASTTAGGR